MPEHTVSADEIRADSTARSSTAQKCPFPGVTNVAVPVAEPVAESAAESAAVSDAESTATSEPAFDPPPADLTVHYDPLSFAIYDYPYDTFKRLRDAAPVYYNADRDLYIVSRYDDVRAGLANHEQLVNGLGNDMDGTHASFGEGMLVSQDGARHTALRQAVRRTFAAREILAREDGLREFTRSLLADLHASGGGDFASGFALPMSIGMGISLLGSPAEDNAVIVDHLWRSMERTVGEFGVPADAAAANQETEELLAERFATRRAEIDAGADTSGSDAYTQILIAQQKGKVKASEMDGLAHLVLSAASDAPAALLTNLVYILDKFPRLQGYLRQRPDLIKQFVEETLRYETPGQNLCRQATEQIEIAGVTIPADSRVMFLQGSANRDERVYPDPDTFDLSREFTPKNRVMTFGEGVHACMGAPYARLAAKVMVEELLLGPDIRIVGSPERWIKQMVRGFSMLPVRFVVPGASVGHARFSLHAAHAEHAEHDEHAQHAQHAEHDEHDEHDGPDA
ncbi:cytochrome P450 [Cryobacterium frigoriphilum]|uniref:Cytochrome P450 n=1 Tax=Cryobacterium frigoriphilum TaxID=1259150 RepID=A0A4R9A893_9MICO|nr:cytochrome P450 [Cryobacterium frigoriphilum]TFD54040.1 cytochrome P450 [Cryobacterium frigoriphilum]